MPLERRLAAIWEQVLGTRVAVDDDFFELSDHSLSATRLVLRVRSTFGADVPLRQIFDAPTVQRFTEAMTPAGQVAGDDYEEGDLGQTGPGFSS